MTCVPNLSQFRLLNHLVGWDADMVEGLTGLNTATGVQLQTLYSTDNSVDETTLSLLLTPSRLAKSCTPCEWYLITPSPPHSRLLKRDACSPCWTEPHPGARDVLQGARGIAVSPQRIAVTDGAARAIYFFTDGGRRQLSKVPFNYPGAIAYATWREWLVVDEQGGVLQRLDMAGMRLSSFSAPLPINAPSSVDRLAVDEQCRVWIAVKQADGRYVLWRAGQYDREFTRATLSELQQAFKPNGLRLVTEQGFCFKEAKNDNSTDSCGPCFSWYGRPWTIPTNLSLSPQFVDQGQLLTLAIDSGLPRCRWHRVRLEADIPSGTTVSIAVSTNELSNPVSQGIADGEWTTFAAGVPHPADWQEAVLNSTDFLIQQPPGRYLFLRLRLTGDGLHTPRVQRIRLDFPRQTSLDQLPVVYRGYGVMDGSEAEDFSERFLSLFDSFLENIDEVIERLPALFDSGGVPDAVLPWLGRFLDIAMDPAWEPQRRRRILQSAPKLYRMRGTVDGMRTAIHLVFDVDPVIQELPIERPWGAVGEVRLSGGVRLFGRSSWRFRLGRSQLCRTPLRSFGNPDHDPFNAFAHRFTVLVPLALNSQTKNRLQQLIDAQKPAHTLVKLHDASGAVFL
jgi:phage tail-like protein